MGPIWAGSTALVPTFDDSALPVPLNETDFKRRQRTYSITGLAFDVRAISPREMDALGFELYVAGHISWDDYAELAFQPHLHPDYDATIGALTGEQAEPDQAQDFVKIWDERLAFDLRYNGDNKQRIQQKQRIVRVMRRLAGSVFYDS